MTKAAELAKIGEVATNSQIGGRRNIVINGAMQVAQRGAATSAGALGDAVEYGNIDRFKIEAGNTAGRFTMEQTAITDLPGFANCMELTCTTADTDVAAGEFIILSQYLEGQDVQQMKKGTSSAEAVTVSFYVKGNASATHTLELRDNDNSRFNSQEFPVTTDWVRISRTFVGDTTGAFDDDNALSLKVNIWLHAGSTYTGGTHVSNTWGTTTNTRVGDNQTSFVDATSRNLFITGVQLEVGSVATPFESKSFCEELALCQRYYQWIPKYAFMVAVEAGTTTMRGGVGLPTNMRANPTIGSHNLTRYDDDDNTFSNKTPVVFANSGNNNQTDPEAGGQSGHLGLAYNGITSGGTDNHNVTTLFGTKASLDAEL